MRISPAPDDPLDPDRTPPAPVRAALRKAGRRIGATASRRTSEAVTALRRRRHALVTAAVWGVVIEALLLANPLGVRDWLEERAIDWAIHERATSTAANSTGEPGPTFVFLDIDDRTAARDSWSRSPYTPRDKLLALVRYAVENGAVAVIVDVNLTRASGRATAPPDDDDKALAAFLRAHAARGFGTPASCAPLVILNREFAPSTGGACRTIRRSFLDDELSGIAGPVAWGSVQFRVGAGGLIRYWSRSVRACSAPDAAGVPVEVPSVVWLASQRYEQLRRSPPDCGLPRLEEGGEDEGGRLASRIVYAMPWTPPDAEVSIRDRLTTVSAGYITEASGPISGALVQDRIVVIGSSSGDAGDIRDTPLGWMPGALVLANAVDSLSRGREVHHLPWWAHAAVALALIAGASLAFAFLHHFWAHAVLVLATGLVLIPTALWAFRHGYWVDFLVPLVAVELHHLIAQAEEALGGHHPRHAENA